MSVAGSRNARVLDTNILVRATKNATGPAREVLTRLRSEPHRVVISPFVLAELERALNYPRVRAFHRLTPEEMQEFVADLHQLAEVVHPPVGMPGAAIARDPDDDPIVQTALLGNAEVVCTLDRHLRHPDVAAYCTGKGIQIMTDLELLKRLRGEQP